MEDQELVSQILGGSQWAFRQLIDQYKRLVMHMITRVIDDDRDREELCQDVFVRVYEKLDGFHFESKLSTWIATIAYRLAINHLRKTKKRQEEQDIDQVAFQLGEHDRSVEQADYARFIQSLINQMPAPYRLVLTLFYLEGFSYPEIMEITDMPEGTVKNYLFRARHKLKELSIPYIGHEIEK